MAHSGIAYPIEEKLMPALDGAVDRCAAGSEGEVFGGATAGVILHMCVCVCVFL